MDKYGKKNEFQINKALESVKIEKENVQSCLKAVIETRKTLKANLDDVQNQLFSVVQDAHKVQSSNAINSFKIQNMDEEVCELEGQQSNLAEQIKSVTMKMKEYKNNTDLAINALTRKADNLCELFLSAAQIETDESKFFKIFSDINELNSELQEKETKLHKVKNELEEFVFYGTSENQTELLVSLDERQVVMNVLEDQLLNVKLKFNELKDIEAKKETTGIAFEKSMKV